MSDPPPDPRALGVQKGRGEKSQRLSHITKADTRCLPLADHMTVHESLSLWWNKGSSKTATSQTPEPVSVRP